MMGLFSRLLNDAKLYFRFGCRRLGVPGYEVHQIYLPEQQLLYIPIPKNACTSIKHALHEIEFGTRFDSDLPEFSNYREHHEYYKKRPAAFTSVESLKSRTDVFRFALVREPVKRLISCYRNRVVDLGDLKSSLIILEHEGLSPEPDLNTFVLNLEEYRKANKNIEHHSRPQARFLGGTTEYLDRIYTMDEMPQLVEMLKEYSPGLEMRKRKTGGTEVSLADLSEEALKEAVRFYREDYELLKDYFLPEDIVKEYEQLE